MAMLGEESLDPMSRLLPWSAVASAPTTRDRRHNLPSARREAPLDYAVMTEGSAFPAGWVRFNKTLEGYVFSMLVPGGQEPAPPHGDPRQAVPAWVGAHSLRAIRPIPEDLTGDMLAAAPAMLALLKQLRSLLEENELQLPGLDLDDVEHVVAIAEGRG